MADTYRTFDVEVPGGPLHVGCWGDPRHDPVVLAAHGITGNHRSWLAVAEALAGDGPPVALVAPDLRGRGGSGDLPGPYGMGAHADDLIRVADAIGAECAVIAGHSMGGFVACAFAARYAPRVSRLVLVDGGPLLAVPDGVDPEALLDAALGPAVARLRMRFASREAYHDFWRRHPAVGQLPDRILRDYADHDLVGEPPELRSPVSYDAVAADQRDLLFGPGPREALARLTTPGVFLRAPRDLAAQEPGLYPAGVTAGLPTVEERDVEDVDHYSILMGAGAPAVAAAIRAALPSRERGPSHR